MQLNGQTIPIVHRRWYLFPCCSSCIPLAGREAYKAGKLHARECPFEVTHEQKKQLEERIDRDCDFLISVGLMDYSLLVGVKKREKRTDDTVVTAQDLKEFPDMDKIKVDETGNIIFPISCVIRDHKKDDASIEKKEEKKEVGSKGEGGTALVKEYYIGIIDFLQEWTSAKVAAQAIKFAECDKATVPPPEYGTRFKYRLKEMSLPNLATNPNANPD